MVISDDHIALLRAMLATDGDEYERVADRLDRTNTSGRFDVLVSAAFYEAVHRRFGRAYTTASVIHFVASARARFDSPEDDIDPVVAERLVLAALGNGSAGDMDDEAKARAQMSLLMALIFDENLNDAGLDEFMRDARMVAESTIARS